MKHITRRLRGLLLALCLLLTPLLPAVALEAPAAENTQPLPNYEVQNLDELKALLAKKFEERDDAHFTVTSPAGIETLVGRGLSAQMVPIVREMMAELGDSSGSGADYNAMNIWRMESGILDGKLYLHPIFMTSQAEEDELDARCRQILEDLQLTGMTRYETLRTIYEYVGTHYTYDKSLTVYSAYEGLMTGSMVCQGYSVLMHKLLAFTGFENRIVTGWVNTGEAHSWNIVKLGHSWYNLDVTWDACKKAGEAMSWNYFLKGDLLFTDHLRDLPFQTDEYRRMHDTADANYPVLRTQFKTGDRPISGLTIRAGGSLPLFAFVNGSKEEPAVYSTDPETVSIAADGTLTAHKAGYCSIMADPGRDDIIPGMLPVTVVDLTAASPWAYQAVTDFYLRGVLPISQCENFQTPLTRAQAARCLYPLLDSAGVLDVVWYKSYLDTVGHEDELFIASLSGAGILNGHSFNYFMPDEWMTREQAAKLLVVAAAKLSGEPLAYSGKTPACTDAAQISPWAASYVGAAMEAGFLLGMKDGSFRPQDPVTLEQFISALERVAKQYLD